MLELRDLELLIRSSVPIIVVETHEERRILDALAKAAVGGLYKPLFRWTVTEGLKRLDIDLASQIETVKPVELFVEIKESARVIKNRGGHVSLHPVGRRDREGFGHRRS